MSTLVLASASPRRHALLRLLLDSFDIDPVPVEETAPRALPVELAVQAIARKKALATAKRHPNAWVLAADTVIVRDGRLVDKARDPIEARAALADLSGHHHDAVTGLALAWGGEAVDAAVQVTRLRMERLPREAVERYVASGGWRGKAGAYGIQDPLVAPYVTIESGAWSNVVGLPLAATADLLRRNGIACREPPDEDALRRAPPV